MPYFFNPKPASTDRVLFDDVKGNEDRRDSAAHVYDDFQNPKAAKMRGGFPRKKSLQELEEQFKRKQGKDEPEVKGLASVTEKRMDGIEGESTMSTR